MSWTTSHLRQGIQVYWHNGNRADIMGYHDNRDSQLFDQSGEQTIQCLFEWHQFRLLARPETEFPDRDQHSGDKPFAVGLESLPINLSPYPHPNLY